MANHELTLAQAGDFRRCMDILNAGREFQREQGFIQWPDGYPDEESVRGDLRDGLGYVLKVDGVIAAYMYIGLPPDQGCMELRRPLRSGASHCHSPGIPGSGFGKHHLPSGGKVLQRQRI